METVETLNRIFGEHTSLFNARFNCLNITKCDTQDFTTSNANGLKFPASQMNNYVCTRILSKIEQNPDITQQQVTEECRWLVNLKHDSDMV